MRHAKERERRFMKFLLFEDRGSHIPKTRNILPLSQLLQRGRMRTSRLIVEQNLFESPLPRHQFPHQLSQPMPTVARVPPVHTTKSQREKQMSLPQSGSSLKTVVSVPTTRQGKALLPWESTYDRRDVCLQGVG